MQTKRHTLHVSKWVKWGIPFCLLTFLPLAATAQSTTLAERYTREKPVIIICDWDKPPYEFLNNSGSPAGSNIETMSTIMKELNLPYRFVMKEWGIHQDF